MGTGFDEIHMDFRKNLQHNDTAERLLVNGTKNNKKAA
jgi:hypothetical protein